MYLPPEAQDRLVRRHHRAQSAPAAGWPPSTTPTAEPADRANVPAPFSDAWRESRIRPRPVRPVLRRASAQPVVDYLTAAVGRCRARPGPKCSPTTAGIPDSEVTAPMRTSLSVTATLAIVNADLSHPRAETTWHEPTAIVGTWPPAWARRPRRSPPSRALASKGPDALLDDPWADPLVRAVGIESFVKFVDGETPDADTIRR